MNNTNFLRIRHSALNGHLSCLLLNAYSCWRTSGQAKYKRVVQNGIVTLTFVTAHVWTSVAVCFFHLLLLMETSQMSLELVVQRIWQLWFYLCLYCDLFYAFVFYAIGVWIDLCSCEWRKSLNVFDKCPKCQPISQPSQRCDGRAGPNKSHGCLMWRKHWKS